MSDTPPANYTAPHGSLAICAWCSTPFPARILNGPNADRFCKTTCKDAWHNERRRSAIKSPPSVSADTAGGLLNNTLPVHVDTPKAPRQLRADTKLFSVLAELARGAHLNRFIAEITCHDHTLNSTISEIQARGVIVSRKDIVVRGHRGKPTHCCEYWLAPDEVEKAAILLGWRSWRAQD